MSLHLSGRECVDAVDGTLRGARRTHLDACAACRREVEALKGTADAASATGEVPDPSPLFWEHFSRRVREATDAEPIAAPSRWVLTWRPMLIGAAAASAVAVAVVLGLQHRAAPAGTRAPAGAAPAVAGEMDVDDASMNVIAQMAAGMSDDELQQAAHPGADTRVGVLEDLTPAQQAELIRLIQAQMASPE